MLNIIEKSRLHFLETFEKSDPNVRLYDELPSHVSKLEKWAYHLLPIYPELNKEILLASVWLHDIGQLVGNREEDHAIRSERDVLQYLPSIGVNMKEVEKIAHCVRAHRCKDVQPKSFEAKVLAAIDSASHLTDFVYILMLEKTSKDEVLAKLERDYRDVSVIPEIKEEVESLVSSWREVINNYPDWVLEKATTI